MYPRCIGLVILTKNKFQPIQFHPISIPFLSTEFLYNSWFLYSLGICFHVQWIWFPFNRPFPYLFSQFYRSWNIWIKIYVYECLKLRFKIRTRCMYCLCNPNHVLRTYCLPVQLWFASNKKGVNILYNRLCVQVS